MKNSDRFLIGIVVGIVFLVVASFTISLRQPLPTYQPENTPDGIVQNYLLAIEQADYERAYTYLSPELPGYPDDITTFTANITNERWAFRLDSDVTLEISSSTVADGKAAIIVRETRFERGDLFSRSQSLSSFTVTLERLGDAWVIIDSGAYWSWCWNDQKGCPSLAR